MGDGGLFCDFGDHSRIVVVEVHGFPQGHHGRNVSPTGKLVENVKVWCVRERYGVLRGSGRGWGHPGTHSGAVTICCPSPQAALPALAQPHLCSPAPHPDAHLGGSSRTAKGDALLAGTSHPPPRGKSPSSTPPTPHQQCCNENDVLILSTGHFTGFLGQVLFLKLKWQTCGKKTKSNFSLENG